MKAGLITKRSLILTVRERWLRQYGAYREAGDKTDAYERLCALDLETCSVADVARAIGNRTWTDLTCDGCGRHDLSAVVEVGERRDYDSATARLCRKCVADAKALLP